MSHAFTLEYWLDDGGYVGRLREIPSVFSQGDTIEELEENIRDAYELLRADEIEILDRQVEHRQIQVEV
jgi:predicted RNase H-like HicB family nuclease